MTSTMTVADFAAKHSITMFVEAVDSVPNRDMSDDWNMTASHWRCLLRHQGRVMTVYFSQGSAHTKPPTVADVLDSVASDSRGIDSQTFEDWAGDYGYDADSIRALKTFKAGRRQAAKLAKFLGPDAYAELMDCESL